MVGGALDNQYSEFNEFSLSEQSHGQPSEITRCCELDYRREVVEEKTGNGISALY